MGQPSSGEEFCWNDKTFCNVVKKTVHVFFDFQFDRLKNAQGAIYLYLTSVVETLKKS